jgi:aminopeptidase YwaD
MYQRELTNKAEQWIQTLSSVVPNRRTGSSGNRDACAFFANTIDASAYSLDTTPFASLDYRRGEASLTCGRQGFDISISPYSLPCDVISAIIAVTSVEELAACDCTGKILLLKGGICAEQLMPKNFVFYNPDHHKQIIALLEAKRPAVILAATTRNPGLVGALYPFPLIVDGDFSIPCAHCTDSVGEVIAQHIGKTFELKIDTQRIPAMSWNVLARKNPHAKQKIVFTAHIDAYEDAPGACDNASGIVVLLLVAELLARYEGPFGIEIVAFNGEDHYSAAGQMDYLARYGDDFEHTLLAVNIDDVGYVHGRSAYSIYECPADIQNKATTAFNAFDGIIQGESWPNGDHMVFVQNGVPAIAVTSENLSELMATITHTDKDTPEQVDCSKLVEVAHALKHLVHQLAN